MSASGPRRQGSNGKKRRSSDLLTIDELINRIVVRAQSRTGRRFLTIFGLVVAIVVVVIPLTRSAKAATPAATSTTSPDLGTSVVSKAPSRTTLPTLPLDLFAPHSPVSSVSTTTSSSSTTTSTTSTTTTTVPPTIPPQTTPQTAPPPNPPDTGVGVPVG